MVEHLNRANAAHNLPSGDGVQVGPMAERSERNQPGVGHQSRDLCANCGEWVPTDSGLCEECELERLYD